MVLPVSLTKAISALLMATDVLEKRLFRTLNLRKEATNEPADGYASVAKPLILVR